MEAETKKYIQDCYPIDKWIEQGFEVGRQEGRREVVEWIKKYGCIERCDPDTEQYFNTYRWVGEEEWQEQLKEWNV